jgi:hypothetical protein
MNITPNSSIFNLSKRLALKALIVSLVLGFSLLGKHRSLFAESDQIVTVTFVLGDVKLHRGSHKSKLNNKAILKPGDIVKTGSNGKAYFRYGNNHEVRVSSNAEVKVNSEKIPRSNLLLVVYGKISVDSKGKPGTGDKQFKVVTPTSVCAVRGTNFELGVSNNGSTETKLDKGSINMSSGDNNVDLNNQSNASTKLGESPTKGSYSKDGVDNLIKSEDNAMKQDPEKTADGYQTQNKYFKDRSQKNADETQNLSNSVNSLDKKNASATDIMQTDQKSEKVENRTEDDYYRNECQGNALTRVLDTFARDKKNIYDRFEQVKRESNKVAEVQEKNLANIRKVREMYEAKRNEIMEHFKKTKGHIWKQLEDMRKKTQMDFNSTKPSFDFNKK